MIRSPGGTVSSSSHISDTNLRRSLGAALLWPWVAVLAIGLLSVPATAFGQNDWTIGRIVGLREGTCIREGPGLDYPAHTRVPEDDWAVRVIGGPRDADNKIWYDTSRRDAGDPSGGTGWVDRSQTDMCPEDGDSRPPSGPEIPDASDSLEKLRRWWRGLTPTMKWIVSIIGLGALIAGWRTLSSLVFRLLGFLIMGFVIYMIADAAREYWQGPWTGLVGPDGPDLAMLLALAPVVSYVVNRVLRR